jgi:hypothetical protein
MYFYPGTNFKPDVSQPALDQAQMMIMPDIEDPFVPLGEGLFVDPYEAK